MIPRLIIIYLFIALVHNIFQYFRLAANDRQYITMIMHIRDLRDKQRLIIKSTDIVLFGPPERKAINCKYFNLLVN